MLRAIVVDDEDLARQVLRELLTESGGVDVVAECANGFEAVKAISELQPDVVFLDIQMPKLDGFEVLELIDDHTIAIIFVTAYDQYALKAFDAHAVDYLLKPFAADRLKTAVERARALRRSPDPQPFQPVELAVAARPPGLPLERIVVKDGTRVHIIPVAKLVYAEAQDDYVALRTEGKTHLKQQTLASLELQLDPAQFVRIHRSYVVNLAHLERIEPYAKDSRVAVLRDGAQLPVSRTGLAKLRERLGDTA